MIKYFVFFPFLLTNAIAGKPATLQQESFAPPVISIINTESNKKIAPVHIEDFKIKIDQAYLNKIDILANSKRYPDDSIKIIPNANKSYGIEQIILPELIENIDTKYFLEAVVSDHEDKEWFVIINKKIYSNARRGIENLFEIIEATGRHTVIKFLKFDNKNLQTIYSNIDNNYKYCSNINPTSDGKAILIKLYIGQYYDIIDQRIYDGR